MQVSLNSGTGDDGGAADGPPGARDTTVAVQNVDGGSGDDILVGSDETNELSGGDGDDLIQGGLGADVLLGGPGRDTVSYADRSVPVTVTLDGAVNDGAAGENDFVAPDVEAVIGGSADDQLTGGDGNDALQGGDGNDSISGRGGADLLAGDAGDDQIDARDNAMDTVDCGPGTDSVSADAVDALTGCEQVALPPVDAEVQLAATSEEALERAVAAPATDVVCVAGSLFLVADALRWLHARGVLDAG